MIPQTMHSFLVIFFLSISTHILSLPLSTKSRWIVDDHTGERVKLAGGNWAGHVGPMLPEGLDKRPLSEIAKHIALLGFNSVRLTYATYMYTHYANLSVIQSFQNLGLDAAIKGMQINNPQILELSLVDAQKAVIDELASNGVMVLLDCQVSKPIWCCGYNDGNGFWGDEFFQPQEWLQALTFVATLYKDTPTVFGMSLRNELRGPRQNLNDWYYYVRKGARTIHKANPSVLVLVSGLSYDLDFSFLKPKPLGLKLDNKLVYEAHRYAFSNGQSNNWLNQPLNQFCQSQIQDLNNRSTFLIQGPNPSPLYITEFGVNMLGNNQADNNFFSCFLMYLAENDLDWNLWALQGSYYFREGMQDVDEQYGIFTKNWTSIRNLEIHQKLLSIQGKIQDPYSAAPKYVRMFHPMSGTCISVDQQFELQSSDCYSFSKYWKYDINRKTIRLLGTAFCLTSAGEGMPSILTKDCYSEKSKWKLVSNYQLANYKDNLCLHYDPSYSGRILTRECICIKPNDDTGCTGNPQSQWFKLIISNAK